MNSWYRKALLQFWFDSLTVAFGCWILEFIVGLPSFFTIGVGLAAYMIIFAFGYVMMKANEDKSDE